MRKRPRSSLRSGLSLIEVVAAIALLVTMFVLILKSWTVHQRQMRRAQSLLTAAELLDQQMAAWYAQGGGPPVNRVGTFAAGTLETSLSWKTELQPVSLALPTGFQKLAVTVLEPNNEPIISTEVVVPAANTTNTTPPAATVDGTQEGRP